MLTQKYINEVSYETIGAAIEVHKIVGPGLLERVYHQCLEEELSLREINFVTEMNIPIIYKGLELEAPFRCDLFVEDCLVVELKAVQEMTNLFQAQLLNYMKLLKAPKGILINFNCYNLFKDGQKTYVNEYFYSLPKS